MSNRSSRGARSGNTPSWGGSTWGRSSRDTSRETSAASSSLSAAWGRSSNSKSSNTSTKSSSTSESQSLPRSTKNWDTPASGNNASGNSGGSGSGSWGRLKPPPAQKEDAIGFVSKGDKTLLRFSAQEKFYKDLVERYLSFCSHRGPDLKQAFLTFVMPASSADNPGPALKGLSSNNTELASLVLSMRKLREAILATNRVDEWSVGVYAFCIRAAILIRHVDSYYPALQHLLYGMHPVRPLTRVELQEFVGYYVLHQACVLGDYTEAYRIRREFSLDDIRIDDAVRAVVHMNYWLWRKCIESVDLYKARMMEAAEQKMRVHALKAMGKSYHVLQKGFVEAMCGVKWEVLVGEYGVGWRLEGDVVQIRAVKKAADEKKVGGEVEKVAEAVEKLTVQDAPKGEDGKASWW